MKDVLNRSALEQASLLRKGEINSVELTKAYLAQIEKKNPGLSAFVEVNHRMAIGSALIADSMLSRKLRGKGKRTLPAFLGVPTGIKDLDYSAGTFTKMGSRAFRYLFTPFDGPVAKSIRKAGFVIMGKLATSEFGAMPITETDIHPPARNPWNPEYSAGGSSGGSGAAVGGGLLPIAPGSDGAGSIRIPSTFCHLFGLKTSRDLMPKRNQKIDRLGLSVDGPMANSVEDAAAFLDVLVGTWQFSAHGGRTTFLNLCRKSPPKLKIRVCNQSTITKTKKVIADKVRRVAERLEELGHHVEQGAILDAHLSDFLPLWQRQLAKVPVLHESMLQPVTKWLREGGRRYTDKEIFKLHKDLESRVLKWFGDADIYLTPTVAVFPPKVGEWNGLTPKETFEAASSLGAFTAMYNVSGQPAANIPLGINENGLPYGLQVAGRIGQDALVLAISRVIEQEFPWRKRPHHSFKNVKVGLDEVPIEADHQGGGGFS
jgi:amidase